MEASISTLFLSLGSSAALSLGLAPDPHSGKTEVNLDLARFNIDLLSVLKDKTKNNLSTDEGRFLDSILADLQLRFVEASNVAELIVFLCGPAARDITGASLPIDAGWLAN